MSQLLKQDSLSAHNEYRAKHGAEPLKWSSKLASNAQNWADHLASIGSLKHASQDDEGENLAFMQGEDLTGRKATDMWYNEIKDYDFSNPGFSSGTGHFTQVVWADTHQLGIAKATTSDGMQFVVARYFPPGNVLSRFEDNVKRLHSKPGSTRKKPEGDKPTLAGSPTPEINDGIGGSLQESTVRGNRENHFDSQSAKEFKKQFIQSHNHFRGLHSVPKLKWSSKLANEAQRAAEEAARTSVLRPVQIDDVGQNMAAMTGAELTGEKVSSMWYDEEKNYSYDSPGFHSSTGSFTQMVWKKSRIVGAGQAVGTEGQHFVVALYHPPGNVRSQYDSNVFPPSRKNTDTINSDEKTCTIC